MQGSDDPQPPADVGDAPPTTPCHREAPKCGFVVVVPPKSLSFDQSDHEFHRELHAAELKRELDFEIIEGSSGSGGSGNKSSSSTLALLAGGGARVINASATTSLFVLPPSSSSSSSADDRQQQHDGLFAVFKGILTNAAALEASVGGGTAESNAALIVRLYQRHGIHLLGRLEGSWSFCLFDAHQGRVLAARAPCGGVPLFEGRASSGALVVMCGAFVPPGCKEVHAIAPGCAKWGWSSEPRPYASGVAQQREGRRPAGDRTILRRSTELLGGGGGQQQSAPPAACAPDAMGRARRWSDASAASSVVVNPDEVARAAAPAVPQRPLHADAPAFVPSQRRSSEGGGGGNAAGAASWRSSSVVPPHQGNNNGSYSQRSSTSRRSSYEGWGGGRRPGFGGSSGSARPSGEGVGGGGNNNGSARPSGEGGRPPLAAAAVRRASVDGQAASASADEGVPIHFGALDLCS